MPRYSCYTVLFRVKDKERLCLLSTDSTIFPLTCYLSTHTLAVCPSLELGRFVLKFSGHLPGDRDPFQTCHNTTSYLSHSVSVAESTTPGAGLPGFESRLPIFIEIS